MSVDLSLPLQNAIIAALKADPEISGRVKGVHDYVRSGAQYPFIRYGADNVSPFNASCISGGRITGTLHIFTQSDSYNRTECKEITALVFEWIDNAYLTLERGYAIHLFARGSQVIEDTGEKGAWHGIVQFEALTGTAAT